jgi:hypothetical protein
LAWYALYADITIHGFGVCIIGYRVSLLGRVLGGLFFLRLAFVSVKIYTDL